jgi:hypothetical protein
MRMGGFKCCGQRRKPCHLRQSAHACASRGTVRRPASPGARARPPHRAEGIRYGPPMQTSTLRPALRRRLVWLLWLAMLVPLAQLAAHWHAVSHVQRDGGDAEGKQALHQTHCDLCLTVAAVSGGALIGKTPAAAHSPAHHSTPRHHATSVWMAAPLQAYRSRAPPFASH